MYETPCPKYFLAAAALAIACSAQAQFPPGPGYLAGHEPDTLAILPPAPALGSPRDVADRAVFKATRALEGTPRWALATRDVDYSLSAMLRDFSCAAGVALTPQDAPKFTALISRVAPDVAAAVGPAKEFYKRKRPYLIDPGVTCVPITDRLSQNWDYPSGHATWSWTIGLLLAELAPDRAAAVLPRARAFGESRVVCGVHNASAVEAGRTTASALVAALHGEASFRADMDAARAELTALRASPTPPGPSVCPAEAALVARTPW